jgi:hypothetical protein
MVNARADFLARGILFEHQIGALESILTGQGEPAGPAWGLAGNTTARRGLRRLIPASF